MSDRTAAKEAGCAGFIDKPVRVHALLADVARHLAAAAELAARAGDPEEPGEAR